MTPPLDRTAIAALIPHAGAMCLLECVLEWNRQAIVCSASSHRDLDHPLRSAGQLSVVCGIEYAAQAMAVHGGLVATSPAPTVGFLASVRNVICHVRRLDDLTSNLLIEATRVTGEAQRVIYSFVIRCDDRVVIEGRAAVVLDATPNAAWH